MPRPRGRPRTDKAPFPARKFRAAKEAHKLKQDVKMLKKAMGQQVGIRDTERDLTTLSLTLGDYAIATFGGSFFKLAEGDDDDNREGKKIRAMNFDIRGALSTPHYGDQFVRIIIVSWADAPGSPGDILKYTTSVLGADGMAVMNSPYERNPTVPYKLIYDKVHKLSKNHTGNAAATSVKQFRIFKKLGGKDGIEMSYTTASAEDPNLNGLRLYLAYGQADTNVMEPKFQLKTRERFIK